MRLPSRRFAAPLLSLLLHAALLGLLLFAASRVAPGRQVETIEIEFIDAPVKKKALAPEAGKEAFAPAAPVAATAPATKASASARRSAPHGGRVAAAPTASAESRAGPGAPGLGVAEGARPAPEALASDFPVKALEAPALGVPTGTARQYGVGSTEGSGAGVTTRATDKVDRVAELEQERQLVGARVDGMMADTVAGDRVASGLVDPYFSGMRTALEKEVPDPPRGKSRSNPVGAALKSYVAGMQRYGKSGNPFEAGATSHQKDVTDPNQPHGDAQTRGALAGMNQYQDFIDGKFAENIVTVVRVEQATDGRLLATKVLSSSGLQDFDAYAVASVPKALAKLPPPPKDGGGIHPGGLVSVWSFEGKLVYAQPVQGAGDMAYLVFGGSFEETTGEVYVNKLDKPKFTCRVKLLAVY